MENTTNFNLPLLWEKIKENAKRFGRFTTKQALLVYYVLKSDDTPTATKVIVYGGIGIPGLAGKTSSQASATLSWAGPMRSRPSP
jgi:hypothetical protein